MAFILQFAVLMVLLAAVEWEDGAVVDIYHLGDAPLGGVCVLMAAHRSNLSDKSKIQEQKLTTD